VTDKRIVLVTGASRGIGKAIALAFAAVGDHVIINFSSNEEAAKEVVKECQAAGGSAELSGFNVGASDQVVTAIQNIKEKHGRIDVLVNNAGISKDGLFIRFSDEDWHRVFNINLEGAFFVSREASKLMVKARKGAIINISSVVGEMGNAGQVAYVSSKAGMIGMTKALARELSSRNITVNAITPGFIETDMTATLDEKVKEAHLHNIPLSRYGSAEEVAASAVFLASNGAAYITGQVLGVNGGLYM
jgi:3-oxoacyl-[acyl-carrier protein] reductase